MPPNSTLIASPLTPGLDPLLMNAFNSVNLAAACILTTVDYAQELGIPQDRWIYPLGGAGTGDSDDCLSISSCMRGLRCTNNFSLGTT